MVVLRLVFTTMKNILVKVTPFTTQKKHEKIVNAAICPFERQLLSDEMNALFILERYFQMKN